MLGNATACLPRRIRIVQPTPAWVSCGARTMPYIQIACFAEDMLLYRDIVVYTNARPGNGYYFQGFTSASSQPWPIGWKRPFACKQHLQIRAQLYGGHTSQLIV